MKIRLNYFWNKKEKVKNLKKVEKGKGQDAKNNFYPKKQSNVGSNLKEKKRQNTSCVNSPKAPVFKVYNKKGEILKYDFQCISKKAFGENTISAPLIEKNHLEDKKDVETVDKTKRNDKRKKVPRQSYSLFFCMLGLAGASLVFAYQNYRDMNQEDYAVYSSVDENENEVEQVSNQSKQEENKSEQNSNANNLDTREEEKKKIEQNNINKKKQVKNAVKKVTPKVEPLKFSRPIEGEVSKIYSIDKVIYSKTLELWKTHDGIDIKAKENTIVKAIEKGTVEKIYDDSFYGKTIVIDHGQGYKSSYSNLSKDVFVKEKQVVTKLAKIGKIGNTAIGEIKDEPHLHFTLIKNNEITDPSSIFQ